MLATAGIASAQSPQSSEDIVQFFAKEANLGSNRGICVGTEEECASAPTAPAATGLDTMVNFNLDSADLTTDARAKLEEFAKALKDNRLKSHNFVVEGYTDAIGSSGYNQRLSERRAQSVADFLVASGIGVERISAVGKGESNPRVPDPYDPTNRRVEMKINLQ
jgi:outer membrane protein OmpA-like peptidoglycan-associated protein